MGTQGQKGGAGADMVLITKRGILLEKQEQLICSKSTRGPKLGFIKIV